MTSANVTQANGFFPFAANLAAVNPGADLAGGDSFSQVMDLTRNAKTQLDVRTDNVQQQATPQDMMRSTKADRIETPEEATENKPMKAEKVDRGEVKEALEEAGEEVKEAVEEELGISEEDLENAMEILGLTVIDLLDPKNLQDVVMEVTGETDPMSLLTDADLFTSLKTLEAFVTETVEEVAQSLEIPVEDFAEVIEAVAAEVHAEGSKEVKTPVVIESRGEEMIPEKAEVTEPKEVKIETTEEPIKEAVVTARPESTKNEMPAEDEKPEGVKVEVIGQAEVKETKQIAPEKQTETADEEVNLVHEPAEREVTKASGKEQEHTSNEGSHSFLQDLTGKPVFHTATAPEAEAVPFEMPTASEIMDQIAEYVKINAKPEMTEMEMQLNPESLGTLNIKVAAKEGVVTAQFTTHSEDVKNALEVQLVQLKETLNEQGVKVEAVEVTVEAHAFHQNMQQGTAGGNEGSEPKKKSPRRIILDDSISIEEMELDDEARIAAEMMKANGGTVDMTV